jgi:N-acetylmuramoyl-L-alanine amidase
MKKLIKGFISLAVALCLFLPSIAYARQGDCGYEGGISSGEAPGKTQYEYQEVCFLSGEPIVLTGTLSIKKTVKQNTVSTTYTYDLQNIDKSVSLRRTLTYRSVLTEKDNGQTIEETFLTGRPSETVRIGNTTYTLSSYDFTRSSLLDSNPAIDYFAGNFWGKKIYRVGGGIVRSGTVIVEVTGNYYGYDQYWGNTEVQTLRYMIESQERKGDFIDRWGGTADVVISSTTSQELKYIKNEPEVISFDGGYLLEQQNNSIMEYDCRLPEFDSSGISTGKMLRTSNSLKIESFPVHKRLPVPELSPLSSQNLYPLYLQLHGQKLPEALSGIQLAPVQQLICSVWSS